MDVNIQPADKGSGICLFDRKDYETEAYRQLEDTREDEFGQKSNYFGYRDAFNLSGEYNFNLDNRIICKII